jgi:4-amino-4-deoxy-L-arabinose transferase-like glycosyltransferase
MLASGDWVTPQADPGIPFWAKPPLSFWTQAATMGVFGVKEFGARISSVLPALLVGALLWRFARTEQPDRPPHEPWLALAMLATMPLFFLMAGAVMTDMALAVCTTAAMVGFWFALRGARGGGYVFFAALGLGLLAKGPVAFPLVGLPLALFWVFGNDRVTQLRRLFAALPWLGGVPLLLAIVLPRYALAEWRTPGFLDYFLVGEHWQRFTRPNWAGDLYGSAHREPKGMVWVFLLYAAGTWVPVALLLAAKKFARPRTTQGCECEYERDRYLLAWVTGTPLFFTLASNTIWSYLQPSLPPLALWLARRCVETGPVLRRWVVATLMLGTRGLAFLYALWLPRPEVSNERSTRELIRAAQAAIAPHPGAFIVFIHAQPHSAEFYARRDAVVMRHDDALVLMSRGIPAAIIATDEHLTQFLMGGVLPRVLRERTMFVGRYGEYTLLFHPPAQR